MEIQVIRKDNQTVKAIITGNSSEAPWLYSACIGDNPWQGEAIAVTCDGGLYFEIETATA